MDARMCLCVHRYELEPCRSQEDIQGRYYTVLSRLREHRMGLTPGLAHGLDYAKDDHQVVFNLENEKRRKYQLEIAYRKWVVNLFTFLQTWSLSRRENNLLRRNHFWKVFIGTLFSVVHCSYELFVGLIDDMVRTREEEFEEQQLREELKCIDILLKKAKKVVSRMVLIVNKVHDWTGVYLWSLDVPSNLINWWLNSLHLWLQAKSIPVASNSYNFPKDSFSTGNVNDSHLLNIPSSLPTDIIPSASIVHPGNNTRSSGPYVKVEDGLSSYNVTITHPMPGRPYLQSSRLIVTEEALGIPKLGNLPDFIIILFYSNWSERNSFRSL